MDLFDGCFGSYDSGSTLIKSLPAGPGYAREDAVVESVKDGNVPYFNRNWVKVPVFGGGLSGAIFVTPDYFSIGTNDDFVRMPLMPATAEAIGATFGAGLPTTKMVRDIHLAAPQKLAADPWGPPYDASMMTTQRIVQHNERVQSQFRSKGFALGTLTSGHKKDVVVTPKMDREHVCIFGWFRDDSVKSAIQGPSANCSAHGSTYVDYSHGIRFVRDTMIVNGKQMSVADVLKDPKLSALVSDDGPFVGATSYSARRSTGPQAPDGTRFFVAAVFVGFGFLAAQTVMR